MRREFNVITGEEVELPDAEPSNEPPPDLSKIDTDELNRVLAQEGSVVRALSEIVFGLAKGTITVTPSLTKQAFVTMLRAKMRT
jgi:hypothetical protein